MPDFNNNPQNQWNNNFPNNPQQPYMQNPNNQYNNPYNNYQGNINPQNPYNMGYIPPQQPQPTKSGNPKLIYIVLIAVIIFLAVIIVFMSTSIRVMFNGGNNQSDGSDRNNIIATENQQEAKEEETTTEQTTTTTTTVPVPETVTVIVTVTEPPFPSYTYKVNNVGLVVYENASFDSKPIDYINDRGTYTIIDQYQNWGKLKSGGWINFDVASQEGGVTYIGIGEVVTQKDPLNLRCAPDSDAKIITTIPKGESVGIYESEFADWYYADYNGKSGFVSSKYISFDNFHVTDIQEYLGMGEVVTKKDPLNVRSEPSTNASVVTTIPKGACIGVYATTKSDWYYVDYNGKSGFVSSQYIKISTYKLTDDTDNLTFLGYGMVNTEKDPLNVRSEPSTDASIVTTIPKGTNIELYVTNDDNWLYTTYNGKSGYVSSKYISGVIGSNKTTVKTNGSNLYLRDSASKDGKILDEMPNGATIAIIEYGNDWCYIDYNGTRGYASTDYLSF